MYSVKLVLVPFLLVVLGASCAPGPDQDTPIQAETWVISPEPTLRVGGNDPREEYLLHGVIGATQLSDGRVLIANGGSSELKYFDANGIHLFTGGGEGNGPGEMRNIMHMVPLPGDSVLILSFRPGLNWFGPEGDFVRSTRIDLWSMGGVECRIGEGSWFALSDGSLITNLEDNLYGPDCPTRPPSPWRQTGLIGRQHVRTNQFDTLAIMPATERNSPNYRVFGKSLLMALGSDRVYAGDTGADAILSLSLDGDTLAEIPTPFPAKPIPESAKTQDVRRFEASDGTITIGNAYLYPENYPRFGRLLLARNGDLWVMEYPSIEEPISSYRLERAFAFLVGEGGAYWRVMSPDGVLIAEVRTPPGLFPLEIGEDYILGLSRDEFDVSTVSRHILSK